MAVSHSFQVTVNECQPVISSTAGTYGQNLVYTIGTDSSVSVAFPVFTQTPACQASLSLQGTISKQGSASPPDYTFDTANSQLSFLNMVTLSAAEPFSFTISTVDNTLLGDYDFSIFTVTEANYGSISTANMGTWTLSVTSLCSSTSFVDPLYSDLIVG